MRPNKGQWNKNIQYKIPLDYGELLVENQGLTYNLFDLKIHEARNKVHYAPKQHVIKTHFINSQVPIAKSESKPAKHYRNYFIGNNKSKWKTKIYDIQKVTFKALYPNIDIQYTTVENRLKYSLIVMPNANPNEIQINIQGSKNIALTKEGKLEIKTIFGKIIESKPIAYTINNGRKKSVKCAFLLNNGVVSFALEDYNNNDTLVIDPSLTFSSFTGSTADNWGFTACSDPSTNLYAGGIVFGVGYPTTPGVFDATYNPGSGSFSMYRIDIGISKFSADGSSLLFSTYLGGFGNETPNSIVCNSQGDLFVMGATSSNDFPITSGAFQTIFKGGAVTTQNALKFTPGSDMFITRINPTGTAILASTYIGGTGNEALNYGSQLNFNYGDQFRGMVEVDVNSNVYFSSTTRSGNFPTVNSSSTLAGGQDAVYGKLDANLSTASFIAYYGGPGFETGNAIQLSNAGDIYVTGGASSPTLPGMTGGLHPTNLGGTSDGFVIKINPTTGTVSNGTYLGTGDYDQAYFVQLDLDDKVYVFGQTRGTYPVSTGVYANPNSGQFIHKLSNDLSTTEWSTTIGSGSGWEGISPTAFLVSNCYDIYISGWGGLVNSQHSLATHSTSNGMPVTSDAYEQFTSGNNFYIAVLKKDAASLKYATYFGGVQSSENHVDGGTSQFDKQGRIYHAVCGACGGNPFGFTTTPGAWSEANNSNNCNLAAFKFELNSIESVIGNVEPIVCMPDPVVFVNSSSNGNFFIWDFGDGSTSNLENPTHSYADTGNYTVSLVVIDTTNCKLPDTTYFNVSLEDFQGAVQTPASPICPGDTIQLHASQGTNYAWSPAAFLDDSTLANPMASVTENTNFQVIVSDICGTDTLSVLVQVFNQGFDILGDTVMCIGDTIQINANIPAFSSIDWSPDSIFVDDQVNPALIFPSVSTDVSVVATSLQGCELTSNQHITVQHTTPQIVLPDSLYYCRNAEASVTVSGGDSYVWSPNYYISSTTNPTVIIDAPVDTLYYVEAFNTCGSSTDSLYTIIKEVHAKAGNDTIVCPGSPAVIWADGGETYFWYPPQQLSDAFANIAYATPSKPTHYLAVVTGHYGCKDTASVFVNLFPTPTVDAGIDYYGFSGDEIDLHAEGSGNGTYAWKPTEYLSCVNCQHTKAKPPKSFTYIVSYTDENGCVATDDVSIHFEGLLYVPNCFTPNSGDYNNIFKPEGGNMLSFDMKIFDRWGEVIFETKNMNVGWDGTYGGMNCPDGVYVWKIRYVDIESEVPTILYGHVTLLR